MRGIVGVLRIVGVVRVRGSLRGARVGATSRVFIVSVEASDAADGDLPFGEVAQALAPGVLGCIAILGGAMAEDVVRRIRSGQGDDLPACVRTPVHVFGELHA